MLDAAERAVPDSVKVGRGVCRGPARTPIEAAAALLHEARERERFERLREEVAWNGRATSRRDDTFEHGGGILAVEDGLDGEPVGGIGALLRF